MRTHCYYRSVDFCLDFSDNMNDTSLQLPYNKHFKGEKLTHMGQRKLLLSEIQLLTEYYRMYYDVETDIHPVVMYVGGSPGNHLVFLHKMFPYVKFILIDGALKPGFDERLASITFKRKKVFELHVKMFTDEMCAEYVTKFKKNNLVFVSDIRSSNKDTILFEAQVAGDMELQKKWIDLLQPRLSMIKFRPVYLDAQLSYDVERTLKEIKNIKSNFAIWKNFPNITFYEGTILFQIWARSISGETRFMVHQRDLKTSKEYEFTAYEEIMSFHNNYTRVYKFVKGVDEFDSFLKKEDNKYCDCYDCVGELKIFKNYLLFAKQTVYNRIKDILADDSLEDQQPFMKNKAPNGQDVKHHALVNIDQVIRERR